MMNPEHMKQEYLDRVSNRFDALKRRLARARQRLDRRRFNRLGDNQRKLLLTREVGTAQAIEAIRDAGDLAWVHLRTDTERKLFELAAAVCRVEKQARRIPRRKGSSPRRGEQPGQQ